MEWKFTSFGPTAGKPGHEVVTPTGTYQFAPKPPLPKRDSYFGTINAEDWEEITGALVEFWVKVAEVFPQYYAGRNGVDPLMGKDVPADNGWNRIVCLLDIGNAKVTTNLWKGSRQPAQMDRVWVIVTLPMMHESFRKLREKRWKAEGGGLERRLRKALAAAAEREAARTALREMKRWRGARLWVMSQSVEETLEPLVAPQRR